MEPLGYLPPAEYEANCYRQQTAQAVPQTLALNPTSLLDTRGGSATIARRWRPERSEGQAQAATLIRVMSCLHMPSIVPGQLPASYCTEVVARLGRSKAQNRSENG
jgi:hypothetical protein